MGLSAYLISQGTWTFAAIVVGFLALLFVASAIKIVKEYERGVIFRLGRLIGAKGPGLFFIIPILDKMVKVDLRVITHDVPVQEVMTVDNVPVSVNAVVYYRVMDPEDATVEVEDYRMATSQIAQTTLRSVVGKSNLDELLAEREKLNSELQEVIDEATDPWGIKVSAVEIKDVELPQDMRRAMAAQAEAERERRARVISAEGEQQAAQRLRQAAEEMEQGKGALYIRTLQTIQETASEQGTNTVIPLPIEFLKALEPGGDGLPFVSSGTDPDDGDDEGDLPPADDIDNELDDIDPSLEDPGDVRDEIRGTEFDDETDEET
jgi:regulator of protease activity HflC (stomatin/prohibitin superfamily)